MTLNTDKADAFIATLAGQLGKPFDNDALYRTFDRNWKAKDWRDDGSWYCVELIAWALMEVGYWDHREFPVNIDLIHVAPGDLIQYLSGEFDPAEFAKEYQDA